MSDVLIETLLDRVRSEVNNCPKAFLMQAMVDTIRDFCQITRAWIYEAEGETISALVAEYDIELPSTDVQPIAIEDMRLDGRQVRFMETERMDRSYHGWRTQSSDNFSYFTQLTPRSFIFPGIPTVNGTIGGLYYRVSLKPTPTATTVDEDQADEWLECWTDGAKSRLMMQEGKTWYKPKRGGELERYYRQCRTRARIRANRSYGNPEQMVDLSRAR